MTSVVNLPCDDLSRLKRMSRPLDGVRGLGEFEELALEVDRDLFGEGREVAGFGDEGGLRGLQRGGIDAGELGELVADGRTIEALGSVDLVAILHGVGDALEDGGKVGMDFLAACGVEQLFGEEDAAAGGAGAVELFDDLGLDGDRLVAEDVALGLFGGDSDARVLGDGLLGGGPPLLEFIFADDLGEGELEVDGGGRVVVVGGQGLGNQLGGLVGDQAGDGGGVGLLADEHMLGRQDVHRGDAEGGIHRMAGFPFEIDDEAPRIFIVAFDLAEAPALVHHKSTRLHGLQLSFSRLEGRIFGEERRDSVRVHDCVCGSLNRRVERRMTTFVKLCVDEVQHA
jgi:hypothetical protein